MVKTVGLIGAGNMSRAIVGGLLQAGVISPEQVWVSDPDQTQLMLLKQSYPLHTSEENPPTAENSEVLILAVKPALYCRVIPEIEPFLREKTIIVSIAAGLSLDKVQSFFAHPRKIVRVMPNTPLLAGEGMSVLAAGSLVGEEEYQQVEALFACSGRTMRLPENLFHGVTAVSGSGPAYIFMLIEAMADAAVAFGIPRASAYTLCAQTVLGSAKLALESGRHPGELKDMVCSPAGTTIAAVQELEKAGFRAGIQQAMEACARRSREMGSL